MNITEFEMRKRFQGAGWNVEDCQSVEAVMAAAGLDWEVKRGDLSYQTARGVMNWKDTYATYRSDNGKPLGMVSKDYCIMQNVELFQWMQGLHDDGSAKWEQAFQFRGGRRVGVTMKMPQQTVVTEGDVLDRYVVAVNNHDGQGGLKLFNTVVRIACENSLRLAMAQSTNGILCLRHTVHNLSTREAQARRFLGILSKEQDNYGEACRRLAAAEINKEMLDDYMEKLVNMTKSKTTKGQERTKDALLGVFHNVRNEGGHGANLWTLYNAASEYADHSGRSKDDANRLNSNLFGSSHAFKARAWAVATDMLESLAA